MQIGKVSVKLCFCGLCNSTYNQAISRKLVIKYNFLLIHGNFKGKEWIGLNFNLLCPHKDIFS